MLKSAKTPFIKYKYKNLSKNLKFLKSPTIYSQQRFFTKFDDDNYREFTELKTARNIGMKPEEDSFKTQLKKTWRLTDKEIELLEKGKNTGQDAIHYKIQQLYEKMKPRNDAILSDSNSALKAAKKPEEIEQKVLSYKNTIETAEKMHTFKADNLGDLLNNYDHEMPKYEYNDEKFDSRNPSKNDYRTIEDNINEVSMETLLNNKNEMPHTHLKATYLGMMKAGCHYGSSIGTTNPLMYQFLFCERKGQHIFDLSRSLAELRKVMLLLQDLIKKNCRVWFVGNSDAAKDVVEKYAMECDEGFITTKYKIGTISNFQNLRNQRRNFADLQPKYKTIEDAKEKIKEYNIFRRLEKLPDFIFIFNRKGNDVLIKEALFHNIPVGCLCDSDTKVNDIMYVVPGNDDTPESVGFFMSMMSIAVCEIKEKITYRAKKFELEKVPIDKTPYESVKRRLKTWRGVSQIEMVNPKLKRYVNLEDTEYKQQII